MENKFQPSDFKNEQSVRWCPGCGDHAILNVLHKAMADLGVAPHNTVVVSGIGCSSRLPYYMNTYGMHTIHGRAAAIATGVKTANPELTVWQISGDGDGLAIGGNHFIHAIRRNVDINMLLFNNKIYGLTKGQYSPTSDRGFVSKSSPYGTTEDPFIPAELCFGARGTFFARGIDVALDTTREVLDAAASHKGASVVEILQNCVIFNNGIHSCLTGKDVRFEHTIHLRHGEKMLFGDNNEKGLVQDGFDGRQDPSPGYRRNSRCRGSYLRNRSSSAGNRSEGQEELEKPPRHDSQHKRDLGSEIIVISIYLNGGRV